MDIVITGGTGSLGSYLTKRWGKEGHRITVISRDPHRQAELSKEVDADFVLTDICNYGELVRAFNNKDILIHAAALKQVDVGEYHPIEFSRVNISGTATVAQAWYDTHKTKKGRALFISSDKAVAALNTYGATKKVGEGIFRKFGYSVVRYGNVVESRGSFYYIWKKLIDNHSDITVRDPEPTRFFLTFEDAFDIISEALALMRTSSFSDGGIFVPNYLTAFSMWDAANTVSSWYKVGVVHKPLLPYEKVHEILVSPGEYPKSTGTKLSVLIPGWEESDNISAFCSRTASRIDASVVLRAIGFSPQEE